MEKTVVELDLVGYSTICDNIEQALDVQSLVQLNQQIQGFIDTGLKAIDARRDQAVITTTGDGAILVFGSAGDAHRFVEAVHEATREHNKSRNKPMAKRVFRSGAGTGDVVIQPKAGGGFDIAGTTVARAVRLEAKAKPGALLVDEATYSKLSVDQKSRYGAEARVRGKRDEEFEARACQFNADGPNDVVVFTEQAKMEAPRAERGPDLDERREVLLLFKQLKPGQYPQLAFLLDIPISQRPPDTLTLDDKQGLLLSWAGEYSRLHDLLDVLRELTESPNTDRPK